MPEHHPMHEQITCLVEGEPIALYLSGKIIAKKRGASGAVSRR